MLKLSNLSFSYKDNIVFKDINFSFKKKSMLISKTGKGKTTLAKILAGIIYVDGYKTLDVGIIEEDYQILSTTCEGEVAFNLEQREFDYDLMQKIVDSALKEWNLIDQRKRDVNELSGGERKRLILASLFCIKRDLYILDDGFEELDAFYRAKLEEKIKNIDAPILVTSSKYNKRYKDVFDEIISIQDKKIVLYKEEESRYERIQKRQVKDLILNNSFTLKRTMISDYKASFSLEVEDFKIYENEIVALIGDNGSGKSSFANHLVFNIKENKGKIGFLIQNPDYQIFQSTCKGELLLQSDEDNKELLEYFDLKEDENPYLLNKESKKKLQGAVNYLLDKKVYILDEIDSYLSQSDASKFIKKLYEKGSLLIISHDKALVDTYCDRVYEIKNSRLTLR